MFSVALSVPFDLAKGPPPRLRARGILPCGVRTFLPDPDLNERPGQSDQSPPATDIFQYSNRPQ